MRRAFGLLLAATALVGAGGVALSAQQPQPAAAPGPDEVLFEDDFTDGAGPKGLITNVYAHAHPFDPQGVVSPLWQVTSGSLFSRDGRGWSGTPDLAQPDAISEAGTGSGVFRLRTRQKDFGDVQVHLRLRVLRWVDVRPGATHGIVLWTRYQSEHHLYVMSVVTAGGDVHVAKKVPGGPSPRNGGTYYALPPFSSSTREPATPGRWYDVGVRVCTRYDGSVALDVLREGRVVHSALDGGIGGTVQLSDTGRLARDPAEPIREPGRVGIRADNVEFEVERFQVRSFRACRLHPRRHAD